MFYGKFPIGGPFQFRVDFPIKKSYLTNDMTADGRYLHTYYQFKKNMKLLPDAFNLKRMDSIFIHNISCFGVYDSQFLETYVGNYLI